MKNKKANIEHPPREHKQLSFVESVLSVGGGTIITIFSIFLEMMIAVRYLDEKSYGIYVLLIAVTNFFIMFIDFGYKTSVTQFLASGHYKNNAEIVSSILIVRILTILILSAIILSAQNALVWIDASMLIVQYAIFIPFMLAFASLDELMMSMLQGIERFNKIAIATIIRGVLRLVLSLVLLAVFHLGIEALLYSFIISFLISALYQFLVLPISKMLVLNKKLLIEMMKFGFPLQISRFLYFVSGRVNIFLLGTLAGPASVAYFSVAERIPIALQRLSESFIKVFFPRMTNLISENNHQKAHSLLNHSLAITSFLMALAALIAIAFSKFIIVVLFTEKYSETHIAFSLMMIVLQMQFLVQIMGYTLTSAGFPKRSLIENTIRTVLTVGLNIIFIPKWGYLGAVYATFAANYIAYPISIFLLKWSRISVNNRDVLIQTIVLVFCAALFLVTESLNIFLSIGIIVLFIVINFLLSTVSIQHLKLIVPEKYLK
ncbi:MAG: oligosaccharide flippase family protein [bacterium]|nr:oligosaccharide flippase family protein [bacterium]